MTFVNELMTKDVVTLGTGATLKDAIRMMLPENSDGYPS